MKLDGEIWRRAVTRVRRAALMSLLLWWPSILLPPLLAWVAFPQLIWVAGLVAVLALMFTRPVVFRLGARRAVSSMQALIRAGGVDLTRLQVTHLLQDGIAQGDGCMWMTTYDETQVRLVAEGREPGIPARSSSPWVWAMGGGGA